MMNLKIVCTLMTMLMKLECRKKMEEKYKFLCVVLPKAWATPKASNG